MNKSYLNEKKLDLINKIDELEKEINDKSKEVRNLMSKLERESYLRIMTDAKNLGKEPTDRSISDLITNLKLITTDYFKDKDPELLIKAGQLIMDFFNEHYEVVEKNIHKVIYYYDEELQELKENCFKDNDQVVDWLLHNARELVDYQEYPDELPF